MIYIFTIQSKPLSDTDQDTSYNNNVVQLVIAQKVCPYLPPPPKKTPTKLKSKQNKTIKHKNKKQKTKTKKQGIKGTLI